MKGSFRSRFDRHFALLLATVPSLVLGIPAGGGRNAGEAEAEAPAGEPVEAPPEEAEAPAAEPPVPAEESVGGRTIALPNGGKLVIVAGSGLNTAFGLASDAQGNLYVGEFRRISRIDANGEITTVAGTETAGYSGDGGPATEAELGNFVEQLAVDAEGNLYFADRNNFAIRRVDTEGVITTVAETGGSGLGGPFGVAVGPDGTLYFSVNDQHTVKRLEADGTITTVAGIGSRGHSGDGGPATEAELDSPLSLAIDTSGNLYIGGERGLRRLDPSGMITTLIYGEKVVLLASDAEGNLCLADYESAVISSLSPDGERTVIAESGEYAWADDGPAEPAPIVEPAGVAVDAEGTIYVSDAGCPCVYRLEP